MQEATITIKTKAFHHLMTRMKSVVGHHDAERHVRNYLNNTVISNHIFEVAVKHNDIPAGSVVKVKQVVAQDNRYHVAIDQSDTLIPISKIEKPKIGRASRSPDHIENVAISDLDNQIKSACQLNNTDSIPISFKGQIYYIAGARKVSQLNNHKKRPKADLVLHDINGQPKIFISHKKSPNPKHYQSYGGVSLIADHKTVQRFEKRLNKIVEKQIGLPPKHVVAMKLDHSDKDDNDLIRQSIFGIHYNYPLNDIENVDAVMHGMMSIQFDSNRYKVTSAKQIINDQTFDPQQHPVIVLARQCHDRNNLGFINTRVMVAPEGCRKVHKWI